MSSLEEFVKKLDCPDEAERIYAAEDLGYLNLPDAVPPLINRLPREPSLAVRNAMFQALMRIDGDAAIEGSIQLLGSEDPQIRNQAVAVLRRKGAASIPFLGAVMRDSGKHPRKLVLDVLSEVHTAGAGEIYAAALADRDLNVVITAVEDLGRILAVEFRSRIEDLLQAASHPMLIAACLEALAGIGDGSSLAAIRRTFPDLARLPDFLLASCLPAMAALGADREFAEAAALFPVRGPHLRPAILSALLAIYPRCQPSEPAGNLLPALRAAVEDGDPPLCRYQAVRVLGFWADRDDVCAFLVSCLSNSDRLVRLGAAEFLRTAQRPGLEPVLAARALEESDEEILQALSC
jgi:HEAT repeat protein